MPEESLCFRVYTHSQTQGNVVYLIYLRLKIGVLPPAGDSAGPRVPLLGGSGALKGSGDPQVPPQQEGLITEMTCISQLPEPVA